MAGSGRWSVVTVVGAMDGADRARSNIHIHNDYCSCSSKRALRLDLETRLCIAGIGGFFSKPVPLLDLLR